MKPYKHQEDISLEAYNILKQYGLVYIAMEERTGKTITSLLTVERSTRVNCLILTKKKALTDWLKVLKVLQLDKTYTATNYHQAHKLDAKFDIVILDEAHSYLSAYPKRSAMWKTVKKLTHNLPVIYLSATPYAQGYQLLFNQLALSSWSPFKKYVNFYKWFADYGISNKVRTPYGLVETYSKCKQEVYDKVKHLLITYTRAELGFEHEPEDMIHYVELSEDTKAIYNECTKSNMFKYKDLVIPLDSPMKLRTTLHMLEGGVVKNGDLYMVLDNNEKIEAILKDFGDSKNLVIMYNYVAEYEKLSNRFKNALILQGSSNAEGVDLSMYDNLVVYSQDFSTAKHSQRRARQANINRDSKIKVHFYLVKGAVSDQVYTTVSVNKTNFIDSLFERNVL